MTTMKTIVLLACLATAAPAFAQETAPVEEVPSLNDEGGFVPAAEPPAFDLSGYVDVGYADVSGDGTSFHPDDQRLPIDYASDPFMTAVNSRGEVASTDTRGRFTNGFLPRSAGIGGAPSFLLNQLTLDLRRAAIGDRALVFARVHFLPRLDRAGSATRVVLEQAFGRVQPWEAQELFVFAGKVDSVFGIEYLDNQSPLRVGVTPSLLARYTTGTSVGLKVLYRHQLAALASVVSFNCAVTNSAPFIEVLQAPDASLTGRPALSGRLGWELNLPGVQVKVGSSAVRAARNDQGDPDTGARMWGGDLRVHLGPLALAGEYLHLDEDRAPGLDKLTGAGPQFIASAFHVRGLWAEASLTLPFDFLLGDNLRRVRLYGRGEQRRGWFEGFAQILVRRLTLGARLDLGDAVALKAEVLFNREYEGAPSVDNDVRTASLVWSF